MRSYILRKLAQALFLALVIIVMNFFILRLTPGNPYASAKYLMELGNNGRPLTAVQLSKLSDLQDKLGIVLDPWPEALLEWFAGVVRLDFGYSILSIEPVAPGLFKAAAGSLWLLLFGLALGAGLGIPLGIYAAHRHGTWKDKAAQLFSAVFTALPAWFLIILVEYLNRTIWIASGKRLSLIPVYSAMSSEEYSRLDQNVVRFWSIAVPVFFLGAVFLALFFSQTRSQTLEVMSENYVRTAHAKGLPARHVNFRHIFRNSLPPLISILSGVVPFIFGAQILLEREGGWSGLGNYFIGAAQLRDYTVLMGVFTLLTLVCVACNFLADIAYALVDPRVRQALK